MNVFVLAAIALVGATVLMLLRPWRRHRAEQEATARELNARVYRDQLAELDRDLAAGTLAAADHAQARSELQRRLLDDTAAAEPASRAAPRATRTSLLLAVALPLAAASLYALLGAPAALAPGATQAAQTHEPTLAEVEQMVAGLAARLEQHPDDPKGWSMLARSYHAMNRYDDAARAFARIGARLEQDPDLLAAYADTLATLAKGRLEGRPIEMVTAALKLDPDHAMALSLAATAAYRRQDFKEAARHWQRLLKQLPPGSDEARFLVKTLAEIGAPVGASDAPAAQP